MAKRSGIGAALVCASTGCREVPTLGSDFCAPHHAEHHQVVPQHSVLIWAWIVVAGSGVAWLVLSGMSALGLR